MIRASLTYHDPIDIYDHFKNTYGNISMLIKQNSAIITFQNSLIKKQILQNPSKIIKGLPLYLKPVQQNQPQRSKQLNPEKSESASNRMEVQNSLNISNENLVIGDGIQLPNSTQRLKRIGALYEQKINIFKQNVMNDEECNHKITQFNLFLNNYMKRTKKQFDQPYKNLIRSIKSYNQNNIIDLEPSFKSSAPQNINKPVKNTNNVVSSPFFKEDCQIYNTPKPSEAKRLYLLNENLFISTLKTSNSKDSNRGQVRIYDKNQINPKLSVEIQQGPYSLMMYENFILTGDFSGHIHFIDISHQNSLEYSNKLNNGLIAQMQPYIINDTTTSMLTRLVGTRDDYKIKFFEIQKQKINQEINSLNFHPREEMLCEGVTMSLQVLDNQTGKFAYGCGRNTYICPSFNKSQRQYINHDQNVMKIKKRNQHQLIQALQRKIVLTDLRINKVKSEVFSFEHDLNNIELYSQNYVVYGGKKGQLGVFDVRRPNVHLWNPSHKQHFGKISDILRIQQDLITCDNSGIICEWKYDEFR